MNFCVITTIDDVVASGFTPAGEVLDDFFVDELVDSGDGDGVGKLNSS